MNFNQARPVDIPAHPTRTACRVAEKNILKARIRTLLQTQNAVLVAHYYVDPDIKALAEETGGCVADSLEWPVMGHTVQPTH